MQVLKGRKGLVIGFADENSIAWGCAKAFLAAGAELIITYLNEKAKNNLEVLVSQLQQPPLIIQLDVQNDQQMQEIFDNIGKKWGKLDFVLHSVAFAPKQDLHGRVTDCSRSGFLTAMDISCYSFIHTANFAEKLMVDGGCLLTISYYGANFVVDNYNMMGPVKAALESSVKYLSVELGKNNIRVNALSPGPMLTRAAGGIANFDQIINQAKLKSPNHKIATIEDVGATAMFLVSDLAKSITGNISYIDCGIHVIS